MSVGAGSIKRAAKTANIAGAEKAGKGAETSEAVSGTNVPENTKTAEKLEGKGTEKAAAEKPKSKETEKAVAEKVKGKETEKATVEKPKGRGTKKAAAEKPEDKRTEKVITEKSKGKAGTKTVPLEKATEPAGKYAIYRIGQELPEYLL